MQLFFSRLTMLVLGAVFLTLGACSSNDSDDSDSGTSSGGSGNTTTGYTLNGFIQVPDNTATDWDVNNPEANYRYNSTLDTAQPITNPVIVGGHVNLPYSGADGRTYLNGDPDDFYRVELNAGQVIELFIGSDNLIRDDLDLVLLDSAGDLVDASLNRGNTESLAVPFAGQYFVRVMTYSGASNYTLTIGQTGSYAGLQAGALKLSLDFAPGQVNMRLADSAGFHSQAAASANFAPLGLKAKAGEPRRRMLFELDAPAVQRRMQAVGNEPQFRDDTQRLKYHTLLTVKQLQQRAEVLEATPNYRFTTQAVPNDTYYKYQWHYTMMNLPQAWDITQGSSDVIVAVIDTGVLLNHPDLRGKLTEGYDFISDRNISVDGDGIDSNANDPGDSADSRAGGSSFHGTHVAGTVGGLTDNGKGVAGSGWHTRVMPLRVLGKGGAGYDYDIEQAIRYALGMSNDSGRRPAQTADILNLSLGGPTLSNTFRDLMDEAYNRGVFVVAAAGNESSGLPSYPAALDTVISVSATDINRNQATYSNYGSTIDVAAPGGDDTPDVDGDGQPDKIISAIGDDSRGSVLYMYAGMMGTSMASPHVAGVIALMKAVNPSLTPQQFDDLLVSGQLTDDLGTPGRDNVFGYGLLNAYSAVMAAAGSSTGGGTTPPPVANPPQLSITPVSLNFGLSATDLAINVRNAGGGSLRIVNISTNSGQLNLNSTGDVDANGLGTYTAVLDRGNMSSGTYAAAYRFESTTGIVDVPVIWQVGTANVGGDAGFQYVLLLNENGDNLGEVAVNSRNGYYAYTFTGIPAGRYTLIAGSDNNNDFVICDPAESCGAYTTLTQPIVVGVNQNISGLDFTVSFTGNFLGSLAVQEEDELAERGHQRHRPRQAAK